MKKLYTKGKRIYPSPPPSISDHLSLLPAAILTLTITLSASDKEVLAYLISCSGNPKFNGSSSGSSGDHPPSFHCDCFSCYMSYWIRWDTSPNQEVIHKIIDAYEDSIFERKSSKGKKERKKRSNKSSLGGTGGESGESDSVGVSSLGGTGGGGGEEDGGDCEVGSVKKIMRFLGERIWGVWGI